MKPRLKDVRGYVTQRDVAWRNLMVATINAGIEQRVFKLRHSADVWNYREVRTYEFQLPRRRVVVHARDIDHDEIAFHVMVEPDATGERVIASVPNRRLLSFCTAAAFGWLERKEGRWLQRARDRLFLTSKGWQLRELEQLHAEPLGYKDRGKLMM